MSAVAACPCGRTYTADGWAELELVGYEALAVSDPNAKRAEEVPAPAAELAARREGKTVLELRNCVCGSTRTIFVTPSAVIRAANRGLRAGRHALADLTGGLHPPRSGLLTAWRRLGTPPSDRVAPALVEIDGVWFFTFATLPGGARGPSRRRPWEIVWQRSFGVLPGVPPITGGHAAERWLGMALIRSWVPHPDSAKGT